MKSCLDLLSGVVEDGTFEEEYGVLLCEASDVEALDGVCCVVERGEGGYDVPFRESGLPG